MADNVTALATRQEQEFSAEQTKMIRDSFLSGASASESSMLLEVARLRRLNPLLRQIHFVKRWDADKRAEVWSYQVSIDGLRAIAERTGKYDGQSDPEWEYDKEGKPTKCVVRVYRKDWTEGHHAAGVAFFDEYAQHKKDGTLTKFWATKPRLMLAKCAEALALRKAFPEDMSGLYVAEEMGAPEAEEKPAPQPHPHVEAAAKVLEAEVVKPPEPKPEPVKAQAHALPPYVAALWNRARKELGNEARAKFENAATSVFGSNPKHSNSWTKEDCASVEAALFPRDVSF